MSGIIGSRNLHTGCDKRTVATDQQRHEGQEYSSPRAHCKCNDKGIFVFLSVLILETIQDHALVASKHFLVETKDKNLADNNRDANLHNRNLVEGNDYASKTTIAVKSTPLNGLLNNLASSVINSYLFVWLFHCHSGLIAMPN